MVSKDKYLALKDLPTNTVENFDDFVRNLLYNSYSLLYSADLYVTSFSHFLDNTGLSDVILDYDSVKSLGIDLPNIYSSKFKTYITVAQDKLWSVVIVADYSLDSNLVPYDPKYDLPIVKGYDLQTVYDVVFTKDKSLLRFGVCILPQNLPELIYQLVNLQVPFASNQYFGKVYDLVIKSAQSKFQMETSSEFCFEEVD